MNTIHSDSRKNQYKPAKITKEALKRTKSQPDITVSI